MPTLALSHSRTVSTHNRTVGCSDGRRDRQTDGPTGRQEVELMGGRMDRWMDGWSDCSMIGLMKTTVGTY